MLPARLADRIRMARQGDHMKWLQSGTLASLLAICGAATAANSECEPQLLTEVRLVVTPGGEVYVPASLSGHEVFFRLSIGSGLPSVLETAVKSLGLKQETRNSDAELTYGGKQIRNYVSLNDLNIGELHLLTRAAPVIPQPGVEAPPTLQGKVIVGEMGSSLLRNVDAELYLAERQLKLFKPFKCRKRSPVYWNGPTAQLPMRFDDADTLVFTLELEGRKVEAGLLAGDRVSTIDLNAARQFFGIDENSKAIEVQQTAGGDRVLFHAMSLTGEGLGIQGAKVRLRRGSDCKLTGSNPGYHAIAYADCVNNVPFNLGTDLLSQLRIYISRIRETIYISRVAQPGAGETETVTITTAQ